MDKALEQFVWSRAANSCEYCHLPVPPFHTEHIVARKHGGATTEGNLALACARCNFHKGPNLAGLDPQTGQMARLFHPRQDRWSDHFRWEGARLAGLSPEGRATIAVLEINRAIRVDARERLILEGRM